MSKRRSKGKGLSLCVKQPLQEPHLVEGLKLLWSNCSPPAWSTISHMQTGRLENSLKQWRTTGVLSRKEKTQRSVASLLGDASSSARFILEGIGQRAVQFPARRDE